MSAPGTLPLVNNWLMSNLASFDFAFTGEIFEVTFISAGTHRVQMRIVFGGEMGERCFSFVKRPIFHQWEVTF